MSKRFTLGRLQVYFEPRDLWIGVYVAEKAVYATSVLSAGIRSGRAYESAPVEPLTVYLGPCGHEFTGEQATQLRAKLMEVSNA